MRLIPVVAKRVTLASLDVEGLPRSFPVPVFQWGPTCDKRSPGCDIHKEAKEWTDRVAHTGDKVPHDAWEERFEHPARTWASASHRNFYNTIQL